MNRAFALFGLLLALSVLVTACSSTSTEVKMDTPANNPASGSAPAATTPAEDQTVNAVAVEDNTNVQLEELY